MQDRASQNNSKPRFRFIPKVANLVAITFGRAIAMAGLVLLASCGGGGGGGQNAPSASTSTSTKAITAFSLAGVTGTINEANKSIAVTMPFGTNVTPLVATFTTTGNNVAVGATAQISGTTANSFASPLIYTVTAADGSTVNYTVTVTVAPSTAKALTAFSLAGVAGTINETNKTIAVTIPSGTSVTGLVATFTTIGASVAVGATAQTSGTTTNNFTSPVVYTVTAADGTTASYTVTVTVALSSAKALTAFSLAGLSGTINETNKTIAVTIPSGTSATGLVATFNSTGASVKVGTTVQTSGATANNFTTPVTYTVTAVDGTTASYTVTVALFSPNDTGITASQCYQAGSDVLVSCSSVGAIALNAQQDGMVGRDANPLTNSNIDGNLGFSFTAMNGGCVKDNVTGLVWEIKTTDGGLRDKSKFYTNSNNGLAGDASGYVAAVNATALCGYSDWRLPTVDELQSIVDYSVAVGACVSSNIQTIDMTWFPNTLSGDYWTSNAYAGNANLIIASAPWSVDFCHGYVNGGPYSPIYIAYVRLVRGAMQSHQFTVSVDGQEVTDNYTGLIWRRCSEGQTWNSTTCSGTALTFTHEQALAHAQTQTGWRLPNVKELSSIADRSRVNPAIDQITFPGTVSAYYWSSSPYINSSYAWSVYFKESNVSPGGIYNRSTGTYYVRLVR